MLDESYWTIVGIVIGWALTTITAAATSVFASWLGARRSAGRMLAVLLEVHSHVRTLISVSENLKENRSSWVDYEHVRKHLTDKHFLSGAVSLVQIQADTNALAESNPIEAVRIRGLLELLAKAKATDLAETSKLDQLYVSALSIYEVGLDLSEKRLIELIYRLAWRHSVTTPLRVYLELRRRKTGASKNQQFMADFAREAASEINEVTAAASVKSTE